MNRPCGILENPSVLKDFPRPAGKPLQLLLRHRQMGGQLVGTLGIVHPIEANPAQDMDAPPGNAHHTMREILGILGAAGIIMGIEREISA